MPKIHLIYWLLFVGVWIVTGKLYQHGKKAKWSRAKFITLFVVMVSAFFIAEVLDSYVLKPLGLDL